MADIDEKKVQARELLIRSKVYRILAIVFLFVGIAVIALIYRNVSGGDAARALENPAIIVGMLVTFLPAFVLSLMSSKAEKKLAKVIESMPKS